MQSVIENTGHLTRKMRVTIPQNEVSDEFNKKINELVKTGNFKGFRKGKARPAVVKLQYGEAVKHSVVEEIIERTLPEAFKKQNIYPVGTPEITLINAKDDAPLEYEVRFEVFPEVKLDVEGMSIEKPKAEITGEQVQEVIEKLRQQNIKWDEVDRAAEKNDLVVIDFEGYIDDALFEGGTAKDFRLELGKDKMIPGFEEPIYGAKAGEEREVNVTFPEDYHNKTYAGKPAKFRITVHKVMEGILPELDEAFAKDLGVSDGTLAGLSGEVRENLERELSRRIHEVVKSQIIEQLLERNKMEVPQVAVDKESERLKEMMQKQFAMQGGGKEAPNFPETYFEDQAKKNVILGLLLSQWITDNQIKPDPKRIEDRIKQIASGFHNPVEIVQWYRSNKEAMAEIEGAVLEEQAVTDILEKVQVVEKDVTFDEIMNAGRGKE